VGGRVVFDEVDPAAQRSYLTRIDELAAWLTTEADVFSESHRTLLTEHEWDLWATLGGGGAADSLHRCLRTKSVLWTDDASVGGFATQRGATAAWTQLMSSWLFEQGMLQSEPLYGLSAKLVGWRFVPTRIIPAVYLAAARDAQWDTKSWPLPEHFRIVETSLWSSRGLGGMLLGIFKLIWQNAPNDTAATQITIALLERVRNRKDAKVVLGAVARALPVTFGLDVLTLGRANGVLEAWTHVVYPIGSSS
jgi:hypothetical protein